MADRLRLSANLFEHLHEGLIVTDVDYRIIEVNPAYEKLSGRSRESLVGELPELLRADLQSADMLAELWGSLRAKGSLAR